MHAANGACSAGRVGLVSIDGVPPRRACLCADFVRPLYLGRPPARTAGRLSTGLYPQDDCPNALLGTGFTARVVNGQRTSLEVTSDIGTIELCIARLASGPSDPCPDHGPWSTCIFVRGFPLFSFDQRIRTYVLGSTFDHLSAPATTTHSSSNGVPAIDPASPTGLGGRAWAGPGRVGAAAVMGSACRCRC